MNKNIITGVVIIIGFLVIWFAINSGGSPAERGADMSKTTDSYAKTTNEEKVVTEEKKDINNLENKKYMNATLKTSKGDITIEFFDKQAPNTVANFLKLAKEGFYSGIKFHRVIKGFMVQAGDPLTKDDSKMAQWGTGGPGYKFADEIDAKSDLYVKTGYAKGVVAMANSGQNTNGSQFFIMTETYPLPPLYTIFGKVISGQNVVDEIANVKTTQPGVLDRPISPIIINSISLK